MATLSRLIRLRLPLLLCALAVASCGREDATSSSQDASGAEPIVFHRGNFSEVATLDPHRNEETGGSYILRDLFEGLTTEAVDSRIVPGTAESWDVSEDGLVYTFRLRETARWSNGDPVVAADFVAGLRRTVDPATASTYAQMLYPIRNAQAVVESRVPPEELGVREIDSRAVEITLNSPTPYFLGLLVNSFAYPVHRASLEEHGARFARAGNLVSNGAYQLSEWVVQSHVKLDRNSNYWDNDNVQIDTVYFHNTENLDNELKRYRAGELDYTYQIPNTQFRWIKENIGDELHTAPYISVYFYGLDVTEPPFDDVRLRQALSMVLDRKLITEKVTGIGEVPAFALVPPGVKDYEAYRYPWADLSDEERIAEAQRLYREAGYSESNPLTFDIRYNTSEDHKRIAIAISSMWRETLGVEARPLNEEWKVLLQTRRDLSAWDAMRYGWVGDYNDAYTFLEIFHSENAQNFTGFSDSEYDRLVERAAGESDADIRRGLMRQAEERVLENYPVIPMYFYVSKHLVKPHVRGYEPNIMDRNYSQHYRIERN